MSSRTPQDGKPQLAVRVGDGQLTAVARREGSFVPTRQQIDDACAHAGVRFGFDEEAIARLCAGEAPAGVDVTIARGVPPTVGTDARVEYAFVLPTDEEPPASVDDDAPIDFREGALMVHVAAGALVARKVPAVAGAPGKSVTGDPLPPPEPRDVALVAGDNVTLDDARLEAFAAADGVPTLNGNRISVVPGYQVQSVNYATGNIQFVGPVLIRGDVEPGFTVVATGDIEAHGIVEGGILVSGGNIVVRGGVRNHARLEAAGSITVRFVDSDSELHACGDVRVQTTAIQSRIDAGGAVIVGRHVTGGAVRAGDRIEVHEAGADRGTPTLLEIRRDASPAVVAAARAELAAAQRELAAAQTDVAKLQRGSQGHGGRLPHAQLSAMKKAIAHDVQAQVRVAILQRRADACERRAGAGDPFGGEVVVRRPLHPGVDVVLHRMTFAPALDASGVRFIHVEGAGTPYVPPVTSEAPRAEAAHASSDGHARRGHGERRGAR